MAGQSFDWMKVDEDYMTKQMMIHKFRNWFVWLAKDFYNLNRNWYEPSLVRFLARGLAYVECLIQVLLHVSNVFLKRFLLNEALIKPFGCCPDLYILLNFFFFQSIFVFYFPINLQLNRISAIAFNSNVNAHWLKSPCQRDNCKETIEMLAIMCWFMWMTQSS